MLRLMRLGAGQLSEEPYVEFDLDAIFAERAQASFALLYLLLHRSRFRQRELKEGEGAATRWEMPLDAWVGLGRSFGVQALGRMAQRVAQAIVALANGFDVEENTALHRRLERGEVAVGEFFNDLLRLVFRIVFVLVGEARGLLPAPSADRKVAERYWQGYAVSRLRAVAQARRARPDAFDLYEGLLALFHAMEDSARAAAIGAFAPGTWLWTRAALLTLEEGGRDGGPARLSNAALLEALRGLCFDERDGALYAIDFAQIGPEELGSIYEALLYRTLRRNREDGRWELSGGSEGEVQSAAVGSYYTPTALVNLVLDCALDPVLKRITGDDSLTSQAKVERLLDLKICDPATGSGHFLIAAARRIAREVARLRSGEEEPSPVAQAEALYEVVERCLYGVDINPSAVELCRFFLALEAALPGRPLPDLELKIVPGDAVLGATPRALAEGIPDKAYQAFRGKPDLGLPGESKECERAARKQNRKERKERRLDLRVGKVADDAKKRLYDSERDAVKRFRAMARARVDRAAWDACDALCAAFFQGIRPGRPMVADSRRSGGGSVG